jgi:hypothetical protein
VKTSKKQQTAVLEGKLAALEAKSSKLTEGKKIIFYKNINS